MKNPYIQTVIFHEIGHLYKTKNHYGETELETGMSDFCVYGDDNYDFLCYNNLTLCDYCRHRIENNITLYNHQ